MEEGGWRAVAFWGLGLRLERKPKQGDSLPFPDGWILSEALSFTLDQGTRCSDEKPIVPQQPKKTNAEKKPPKIERK